MKSLKTIVFSLIFGLTGVYTAQAQTEFEVPEDIQLEAKEDYTLYESDIIDAAKWLEETNLDKEINKRTNVNVFVLQWLTGSPTVDLEIGEELIKLVENNTPLLGIYLASYAREVLENKEASTKFSATKAGLMAVMNVYKKGIQINKNKNLDKLIALTNKNKLDDYIKSKF